MQIAATLVKGKARIQIANGGKVGKMGQAQYSLARAQQSFKSLEQIHEKNGEMAFSMTSKLLYSLAILHHFC